MTRYIADQNKVAVLQESGTYAVPLATGRWPGEVTELSKDDSENLLEDRYLGNASRSYGNMEQGPLDVTGTLTLNPQDMYFLAHAVGSVYENDAASIKTVIASEVNTDVIQNPFISGTGKSTSLPFSFTLEDSKQAPGTGKNFIQQIKGCTLNSVSLEANQGEKVTLNVDWIGQEIEFKSGTTTSITAPTRRPYLWSDTSLTLAGNTIDTAKSISFEVNNNITAPHYLNGSRVIAEPFPGNRDYTLSVTSDLDSSLAKEFYQQYFKGGSTFNATFDLDADNSTGSQHTTIAMSGCNIMSMEIPSTVEGVNENTLEIRPKNVSITVYDSVGQIGSYNPY